MNQVVVLMCKAYSLLFTQTAQLFCIQICSVAVFVFTTGHETLKIQLNTCHFLSISIDYCVVFCKISNYQPHHNTIWLTEAQNTNRRKWRWLRKEPRKKNQRIILVVKFTLEMKLILKKENGNVSKARLGFYC